MTLNVQLRHICQSQTWSHQDSQALGILLGLLHLDFNQVLWYEESVCPVYTSHFSIHSVQAMAICSRNGSSCLNCRISRVLDSWPLWCELLMPLCIVALWLFNKDEVCWHILLTSITYLPLQRRCEEKCFINFLKVVISLSLNVSAHNILNDVLKIYGLVGSLLFNGFSVFGGFLVSVILSSVISKCFKILQSFLK